MFIPCFTPEYDAVLHARIIAKMVCSFSSFTRFWAFYEASDPHFSALEPLKLHLCTLVPMPGIPFPHIPFHHLECPILPFGVSHFTFWGIFSAHLRTMYSPDARFVFFVFAAKVCMFSFLSVHYVSSEFIWLDKIYFITLPKLLLLPWQDTKNTDMT